MKTSTIKVERSTKNGWKEVDFNNLDFGQIATDHMFIADYNQGKWSNARIVPFGNMELSPFTSSLHYGQTVFEGMKAYRQTNGHISIFRPVDHSRRFNHSLDRMCMPQVPEKLFMEALNELIKLDANWVSAVEGASLYIRPFMFATEDKLGVKVSDNYRFMIVCSPVGKYYSKSLRVKVEQTYARAFKGGTGFAKCGGNYGVSFYPYQKAHEEGFDQILWTDAATHQFFEESGTMNVAFIVNNRLITPALSETILAGITRDSLLKLASKNGLKIEERTIGHSEIVSLINSGEQVEAFGIGTAATLAPIHEIWINDKSYSTYCKPDAKMFRLKYIIEDIRLGKINDSWNWNWIVN
jgi:branched-chain amino acid aminotransferase